MLVFEEKKKKKKKAYSLLELYLCFLKLYYYLFKMPREIITLQAGQCGNQSKNCYEKYAMMYCYLHYDSW